MKSKSRYELKKEAIEICKAIKVAENGQLEIDGHIFTEDHARLLKWFLNITEDDIKQSLKAGGEDECQQEEHPAEAPEMLKSE